MSKDFKKDMSKCQKTCQKRHDKKDMSKKTCQKTLLTAEIIKWQKCARMGLNGFHIKCIIGTHCN